MRKYLTFLVVIIITCAITLTGCNLFERDNARYLAQVVAKTKEEQPIEVTMEDLINGYNAWGYQYFQQENVDKDKATQQIINDCIDRKYLLRYFDENGFKLDEQENWKVKQDVYDYINKQISDLESTIRIEWKWSNQTSDKEEDNKTDTTKIYTPYESKFKLDEKGNIVFNEVNDENEIIESEPTFKYTSAGALENASKDNKKLFEEAKNRYFNELKKAYEERGITKKSNDQLFDLEVERLTKVYIENAKTTKLQNYFDKNIATTNEALNEVLNKIYLEFRNKYNEQKQLYSNSASSIESFRKSILDSSRTNAFYFVPEQTTNEFFTVTHLLLKFNDEDQAEIDNLKKMAEEGGCTPEEYQALLASKYQNIKVKAVNKDTGIAEGEPVAVADILHEIELITTNGKVENLEKFREIQFKYQGDTAVYSATFDYVIPMDSSKDTMVKPFADMARELRGNGSSDNVGKVSGLVKSEFGYHIIVYTGEVSNFVNNIDNKESVLKQLFATRLKADRNKTYLDLVYESVSSSVNNFNTWVEDIVKTYRNGVDIKMYPYRYKKLYE